MTIVSVDTNVLIYAVDEKAGAKQDIALTIVNALRTERAPLSLQVVSEFLHVASRKYRTPPKEVAVHARELLLLHRSFGATQQSTDRAIDLAASGTFSFCDANLVSAAEAAGCTHLISEDMGDGVRIGRLEIVNPFSGDALSERARALLSL
ncbi:PIN domain-containing protein [Chthonobacter rhizosphaerae]|uniref:PIN domain-containing protein n=1 Tax=Chthonobacter rhizosphaerae TaxID=2735553 RepID=UPI0015EEF330|nr:PIN domain-containing protein [Chthonobacter rhizosphaerae]